MINLHADACDYCGVVSSELIQEIDTDYNGDEILLDLCLECWAKESE